ncbi:MAG: hypothetical protein KDA84_14835, partial [Planctomycetaceae bacterium]|nr:hypothetical protein [Planctomycetaceae bacterium]
MAGILKDLTKTCHRPTRTFREERERGHLPTRGTPPKLTGDGKNLHHLFGSERRRTTRMDAPQTPKGLLNRDLQQRLHHTPTC